MLGRRGFLGAAASAAVVGFDPSSRVWVTEASAAPPSAPPFDRVPPLDGQLVVDDAAREAVATDLGNIVHRKPHAVLRPGSTRDIATVVRFCREHRLGVSTRGQGHTTHGQGLSNGVLIENKYLNRVHSLTPRTAVVDSGIKWMDLTKATYAQTPRTTPPTLTAYTGLSVGGTLSVGGIGGLVGGLNSGLQVDHVRELEVVTGTGDVERCSRTQKSDLFEAVLGGLGQCGVITKAALDLAPAKENARTYALEYGDTAAFCRDLRTLIDRQGVDHVYAELFPPGTTATYKLYATAFFDGPQPDNAAITRGLSATPQITDAGYLDYAFTIDNAIDELRATMGWDRLIKPWYDIWLPGSTLENYLAEVVPTLTPRDIGPYGAGLIYPQRRSLTTRPFPRLPRPDGTRWAFVLDINTVAEKAGPDPAFVEEMLARNARMFARARDAHGATLYPIGSVPFTARDWRLQYGDRWQAFQAAKRRYDPSGILTPGPAIFG
ncbi:FAD-binding protein [Actinokineospora cianjurensis]|uniref:FAD/FMN-containing dehydrogenase n=1 Tax=Actinokineospora cianjurensis TaxID=585224 RepID=A0A421B1B5_9PSEU|nr:FAD-binding protein [Actinokineospora cianjurensis]RLK58185.1 FAD/FMN-containing dehydrogenase [Actinokineospora cianjurensis]